MEIKFECEEIASSVMSLDSNDVNLSAASVCIIKYYMMRCYTEYIRLLGGFYKSKRSVQECQISHSNILTYIYNPTGKVDSSCIFQMLNRPALGVRTLLLWPSAHYTGPHASPFKQCTHCTAGYCSH